MKLTLEEIQLINALGSFTNVSARDCLIDNKTISFVVPKEKIGKAIGKNAENIKTLGKKLNKTIEIYGFFKTPEEFLKNAFSKAEVNDIEVKEKKIIMSVSFESKRSLLRNKGRFNRIKKILKKNYGIESIRIK